MQFRKQPQSMQWKIAFLIIALVSDVSCIRNGGGGGGAISAKLKNFFPSEQLNDVNEAESPQTAGRQSSSSGIGFRPSQMLEFTPADAQQAGLKRYPPSYLEPNYKYQVPSSLASQPAAMDKQFAFPEDDKPQYHSYSSFPSSTALPTTPVVSYLDPYTQQNYRYTPTPPPFIQYQREQPEQQGDQAYTVQSSLLVGNHAPHQQRPGIVEDVYLKRPGYVFDEHPLSSSTSAIYRRPTAAPPARATAASANKISYDSHDYPPPSYAAQQTSNFVPQRPKKPPTPPPYTAQPQHRPPYNRQDVNDNRPLAGSSIYEGAYAPLSPSTSSSSSSNYANNFGNYLQRPPTRGGPPSSPSHYQYEPLARPPYQQQYQQQQQKPAHNYYEYQIGEIPPQPQTQHQNQLHHPQHQQQQLNYRPGPAPGYRPPYHPSTQSTGESAGGGLATLASLFTSTQQYAPQFTNLLLGGGASPSSTSSNSPLGSLLGAFTGAQSSSNQYQPTTRPPNTQLIRALENIARNDDLQCVPKVLCQMIAGQTLRGQLPGFITSPAITNFLAGFPAASPALIYGRAALLGISGGERSCIQTYAKCPKNEMEIIHYLNNHRGGFFKFFSEPEEQPAVSQQSEGGGSSFLSILSALTGGGGGQVSHTTPRPPPRPTQAPSTDIANGIGSFFTRILSEYLSGVEYQRRRRRRSLQATEIKRSFEPDGANLMSDDFHDEEDDLDTQTNVKFQDDEEAEAALAHTELIGVLQFPEEDGEERILHFKDIASEQHNGADHNAAVRFPSEAGEAAEAQNDSEAIFEFNREAAQRKLRFPSEQSEPERQGKRLDYAEGWRVVLPNELGAADYGENKRRGKRIVFKDTNEEHDEYPDNEEKLREEQQHVPLNAVYQEAAPPQRGARVIFPDHYERYIRRGKILHRPTYAPSYDYKEDRLVVSDAHRPEGAGAYYRLETNDAHYQTNSHSQSFMNYGEYLPEGNKVRFGEQPNYNAHYNYPNTNYISDNRYSSAYQIPSTRQPKHEDDKNIYVTNAHGITEYYIKPDGSKVYLGSG
ncbi:uncharacterized protein LOC115622638 [Scaptodrosophila lebanonensis]|uniref:Uncharacterized protein LOC115622638 n=1 Tax=Drosophila lebanonensis TaxID=7225 RepID=A0A6J2T6E3_DROLE|nr:uncharacterized protein LOC115622638 [Scaptodrosophila lebanonensis]